MSDERADRTYPQRPLVGVGAVVLGSEKILLAKRGKPPAKGSWSLPGGLIELGETAEQAIIREVMEETGLTVRVGPVLGLFEPIHQDADGRIQYHYVVIDFAAYYESGILEPGDDAADLRWVLPADLPDYNLLSATQDMIDRALRVAGIAHGHTTEA